jgi:hypothetical protein
VRECASNIKRLQQDNGGAARRGAAMTYTARQKGCHLMGTVIVI